MTAMWRVGTWRAFFRILVGNRLAINLDKCKFAILEINFLGHHLCAAGVTPLWDSLQVIFDSPRSTLLRICSGFWA
jgi:hypothetical protein